MRQESSLQFFTRIKKKKRYLSSRHQDGIFSMSLSSLCSIISCRFECNNGATENFIPRIYNMVDESKNMDKWLLPIAGRCISWKLEARRDQAGNAAVSLSPRKICQFGPRFSPSPRSAKPASQFSRNIVHLYERIVGNVKQTPEKQPRQMPKMIAQWSK